MPDPSDSAWRTGKKVMLSFRQEEKVRLIAEKLRGYIIYLTHHAVTNTTQDNRTVVIQKVVVQSDEQYRMLQWLSDDDPSIGHNRAVHKKQQGSGQWFLESADFNQWRVSPRSLAWLHGIRVWPFHPTHTMMILTTHSWLRQDRSLVGAPH